MQKKQRIYEYIKKYPGLTQSQIFYRLKIPQSTIKYHITQLINENKITKESLFKVNYFAAGIDYKQKMKGCIENNQDLKRIYKNLIKECNLDEISESCNMSKSLMSRRLKILRLMGIVEKRKEKNKIYFSQKLILYD